MININKYSTMLVGAANNLTNITFTGVPGVSCAKIKGIGSDIFVHKAKKSEKQGVVSKFVQSVEGLLPKEKVTALNLRQKLSETGITIEEWIFEELKAYEKQGLDLSEVYRVIKTVKSADINGFDDDMYNDLCLCIANLAAKEKFNPDVVLSVTKSLDEKIKFAKMGLISPGFLPTLFSSTKTIDANSSAEIINSLNPEIKKIGEKQFWLGHTLCNKDELKLQKEKVKILNTLDESYIKPELGDSYKAFLYPECTNTANMKSSINYLNSIKDKQVDTAYANFVLNNNLSCSINAENSGQKWDFGRLAYTKEELRTQLSLYRDNEGKIVLTDSDIENILNSENSIRDLSQIINTYQSSEADITGSAMTNVLMTEGITFALIKPAVDIMDTIKNDEEFGFITETFDKKAAEQFYSKLLVQSFSEEEAKQNLELLKLLKNYNGGSLWKIFEKEKKYAPQIIAEIIADANLTPDELKALLDNGLLDNCRHTYSIKTILEAKTPENCDINAKARKLAQSEYIPQSLSAETLKSIIELDSNLEPVNLEYFKNIGEPFLRQSLTDKIKLVTSKKKFDENTTNFLIEMYNIVPKDDKGVSQINLGKILLNADIDYKKAAELLKTVRENELYDILPKKNIIEDLQNYNTNEYEKYVNSAAVLKNYPKVQEALNLKTFPLTLSINAKLPSAKTAKNIMAADKFISENQDLWELLSKFDKYTITSKAVSNKEDNAEVIEKERVDFVRSLIADGFGETEHGRKFITSLLSEEKADIKNIKANIRSYKDVAALNAAASIESTTALNADFSKPYKWLSLDTAALNTYIKISKSAVKSEQSGKVSFQIDENNNLVVISGEAPYSIKIYDSEGAVVKEKEISTGIDNLGNFARITKTKDKFNETEQIEYYDAAEKMFYPVKEIITKKDDKGKVLYKDVMSFSNIDGVLNVERRSGFNKVDILSAAKQNKKGTKITKKLTSLDGTKTDYTFTETKKGARKQTYKITDKDGKVLLCDVKTYTPLDKNTVMSTHNGKKFRAKYTDSSIVIYDYQKRKTTKIDLDKLIEKDKDKLIAMLKGLSGEELIMMSKYVNKLTLEKRMDSAINRATGEMFIGSHKFIFEHELGHGKDSMTISNPDKRHLKLSDPDITSEDVTFRISDDPELIQIYMEEKALFEANFGEEQRKYIDYFIKNNGNSPHLEGLFEIVAETNAILNNQSSQRMLSFRTQYLEQYFPRTIACTAKKLNKS